jgi:hypothetical protein
VGNIGIKISEQGYDVKTAADINLILKTDFTLLKVAAAGTVNISGQAAEITHSLGYKPQFLVYALTQYPSDPDTVTFMETSNPVFEFTGAFASVDNTKMYIYTDAYVVSCYYFIFYEGI